MYQRSGLRLRSRPREDSRETLRPRGRLRFSSRSLERDLELYESVPEPDDSETESEPESDDDSDPDSDSGSEAEETDAPDDRFVRFLARSVLSSFSLCFSLASKIRSAVPLLFLNSSGTSTDGFPSAFNLASTRGFSSCAVRDGRETYGREALHSYVKWPVLRHF